MLPRGDARSWSSLVLLLQLQLIIFTWSGGVVHTAGLPIVKIGALLGENSTIGQVILASLQLAVQDVNANTSILPGYELSMETANSACDPFQGAAAAVELLKGEVVAIAGPQTSQVAQFVSALGGATQVPVVSFSATDPSLTEANNPFFLRTVHNDVLDMQVLADLIQLYGWREVAAVSTNNYVGVDSLDALSEALNDLTVNVNFVYRAIIPPNANASQMVEVLNSLLLLESRVYIVHLQPSLGRLLFNTAQSLSMVTSGYVWLMSEAMSSILEDLPISDPLWAITQGVVAVRSYVPPSSALTSLQQRLSSQLAKSGAAAPPITLYGYYAYDTVWMIARAIHTFLGSGGNFTFAPRAALDASSGGSSDLATLQILQQGNSFLQTIKDSQFVGISGPVQLDSRGDRVASSYEIMNLIGKSARVLGYWNNNTGFSRLLSSSANSSSPSTYTTLTMQNSTQLNDVIWPGGSAQIPRGWTVVNNGQKLKIGVPLKVGFEQFVTVSTVNNVTTFSGFCINVFDTAVSYLAYELNYTYIAYGNGNSTPNYDDLVAMIPAHEYDAVVGDVTITEARSEIVDFTQPYTESGLVVVVPTVQGGSSNAWAFMRPFTPLMWVTTGLFFFFSGLAIWILEHKKNKDFRGKPKKQVVVALWFICSTLFFAQQERTKSTLAKFVLIIWLFVVLIITSSYTASLTSILTIQQLVPTIQGIDSLVSSSLNIGYQAGSFVQDYLEQMNVPTSRLIPLSNEAAYDSALTTGQVGAIVDELPYIDVFLSSECSFTIAGQEFDESGWGFAFPKGSQLAVDVSTAILQMSENGRLQQIYDYWLSNSNCGLNGPSVQSNNLGLDTFWGLFLITGTASVCGVIIYWCRLIWQHHKTYTEEYDSDQSSISRSARGKSFLKSLVTYIEEAEKPKIKANKSNQGESNRSESGMETGASTCSEDPRPTAPSKDDDDDDDDSDDDE